MVVVAIDGSTANVPTTPETLARWGTSSSNGRPQAAVGISAAYDPLTRQLLDATLNRCSFNERAEVPGHLAALPGVIGDLWAEVRLTRKRLSRSDPDVAESLLARGSSCSTSGAGRPSA